LGVLADIPTIGCGKTVFSVDGLNKENVRKLCEENLKKGGDYVKLVGKSNRVWGAGFRSNDKTTDPIIVSIGHKISLETAIEIVRKCCKTRVPEPIRQADLKSRAVIKEKVNKNPSVSGSKNKMKFMKGEGSDSANSGDENDI